MVKKLKKTKKNLNYQEPDFFTNYCNFIYKYFGRKLLENKKFNLFFTKKIYNPKFEFILKKANLKIMPEEFFLSIFITVISTSLITIILSFIYLFINLITLSFIFYGGVLITIFLTLFLYNYPSILVKSRKDEIDAAIPYILPYLKLLSKELSLSKIVEIIDDFLVYNEIRQEFLRIKYYSEFLGYDIQSSIRVAMRSSPSRELSDILNDLVSISNSGGNIYNYLDRKLKNLNVEINAIEKKNTETLLIFSQVYVILLLISPLFFTIMVSILNLITFGSDNASKSGNESMFLITVLLLAMPFLYIGFIMLIYYSKPLYSRLKQIENEN